MMKSLCLLLCLLFSAQAQYYSHQQRQQTPTQPIPAVYYYPKPCFECKSPLVTVVQIPSAYKDISSETIQQYLQQQLFLQSMGLGSLGFSPMMMGLSGGMGGGGMSGGQQGMSYYQQMQMLAMMQMAKRISGHPVQLQPVIRTTAEYKYPGRNVLFLPPYISTQYKPQKASPQMRKGLESTTQKTIVVAEAVQVTRPPSTRLILAQPAYNKRS
ncbi:unnamed protein product, partial [Mesorhabditis belari]|uniref:Uncharacterized protein n=1 Tax=Mesorhabditis belari TaxID=2138241 RepID=A0AAF3FCX3_9BILA